MDPLLIDLLFSTDLSTKEIALRLGTPLAGVKERIAALGLGWVRAHERMSRGHAALFHIMTKLLPGEDVITEQPIGERLKIDVYCPRYRVGAEYHGQQHYAYNEHFHGDMNGFFESRRRDDRKLELCKLKGVTLVVFDARDPMTEDYVYKALLKGLQETPLVSKVVKTNKAPSDYQVAQVEKQRAYRKSLYQQRKQERKL